MRKLTNQEKEMLQRLYEDKELLGKGNIRRFLIVNTYEPKYKIGDFVLVTDLSTHLYGNPAKNVKCKINKIDFDLYKKGAECVQYECIALDQNGNDYYLFAEESINGQPQPRHISGRCEDNINVFEKKNEYKQSTN